MLDSGRFAVERLPFTGGGRHNLSSIPLRLLRSKKLNKLKYLAVCYHTKKEDRKNLSALKLLKIRLKHYHDTREVGDPVLLCIAKEFPSKLQVQTPPPFCYW